jgi:MFS family permease
MSERTARASVATSFRALRHRNFRLYWTGQLISLIGTWMQSLAQGWLMHRLTSSPFMLGLLGFCQFAPVLLFSLWAGVIADRVDKRRLLLVTQSVAMVQAIAMATVSSTGVVQPWMLLGLALLFGVFNAFDLPARQAFLVEMVGKEDLSNAIALNSAAFNAARVIGPAFAGVLVATLGEQGCFWINAISYLAVLYSLWRIQVPVKAAEPGASHALAHLREGVSYAWHTRPIRNLLLLLGVTAGLGFQYLILLPVYTRDILHAGAGTYGLLVSAFGVGSLLSAAVMTQNLDRWALRRNLLVGLSAAGVGMGTFAWSRVVPLTAAMGFVAGFGLILYVASTNTMLQHSVEDRFRGRVMSLYTLMLIGTAPLGSLLLGSLAQRFGAPSATSVSALSLLGGALWVSYRLRVIAAREAASPVTAPMTERLG